LRKRPVADVLGPIMDLYGKCRGKYVEIVWKWYIKIIYKNIIYKNIMKYYENIMDLYGKCRGENVIEPIALAGYKQCCASYL